MPTPWKSERDRSCRIGWWRELAGCFHGERDEGTRWKNSCVQPVLEERGSWSELKAALSIVCQPAEDKASPNSPTASLMWNASLPEAIGTNNPVSVLYIAVVSVDRGVAWWPHYPHVTSALSRWGSFLLHSQCGFELYQLNGDLENIHVGTPQAPFNYPGFPFLSSERKPSLCCKYGVYLQPTCEHAWLNMPEMETPHVIAHWSSSVCVPF